LLIDFTGSMARGGQNGKTIPAKRTSSRRPRFLPAKEPEFLWCLTLAWGKINFLHAERRMDRRVTPSIFPSDDVFHVMTAHLRAIDPQKYLHFFSS
jgi:hypothetical protein